MKIAYTDYPFTWLGDEECKEAPIRQILVEPCLDGFNKYVTVHVISLSTGNVCGMTVIKAGYIYEKPGRYGEVPCLFPRKHIGKYTNDN